VELIGSDVEMRGHMNERAGIRWKARVVFRDADPIGAAHPSALEA